MTADKVLAFAKKGAKTFDEICKHTKADERDVNAALTALLRSGQLVRNRDEKKRYTFSIPK